MLLHNRPEFLSTIPAYVGFVLTECLCVFFNPEGIKQIIILFGVIHLFYLLSFWEKKLEKKIFLIASVACWAIATITVMSFFFIPQEFLSEWKIEILSFLNIFLFTGGIAGIIFCW